MRRVVGQVAGRAAGARRAGGDPRAARGFALLVSLGFTLLLALAVAAIAASARFGAALTRNNVDLLGARELARAAVEAALADLMRPPGARLLPRDGRSVRLDLPAGEAIVAVQDERGKLDLNAQPMGSLSRLVETLAAREDVAPPDLEAFAEARRRRPLAHLSEIETRLGWPPRLAAALAPYVTVQARDRRVNVGTASEVVLRALPGLTPALLAQIDVARARGTKRPDLGEAEGLVGEAEGPVYAIAVAARSAQGPTARVDALVRVGVGDASGAGGSARVVEWRY